MTKPLPAKTTRGPRKGEGGRPKVGAGRKSGKGYSINATMDEAKIIDQKIETAIAEGKAKSRNDYIIKMLLDNDL